MKHTNKTKIIVDAAAYIGLFCILATFGISRIYKLIYKKPTMFLLYGTVGTIVVVTVVIIAAIKKYGSYREKDEAVPPFLYYLATVYLWQYFTHITLKKVDKIAETTANVPAGILQITAILVLYFILLIVCSKISQYIERRYNLWKKSKSRQE